jgi:hypothetical protein
MPSSEEEIDEEEYGSYGDDNEDMEDESAS